MKIRDYPPYDKHPNVVSEFACEISPPFGFCQKTSVFSEFFLGPKNQVGNSHNHLSFVSVFPPCIFGKRARIEQKERRSVGMQFLLSAEAVQRVVKKQSSGGEEKVIGDMKCG